MEKKAINAEIVEKFVVAAAINSRRVHVIPTKDGWLVKKEGLKWASAVKRTIKEAIIEPNKGKNASRIVIHKKDGTV